MRQNFSQQSRAEMPLIPRPDSLDGETLRQLSDDGFNPAPQTRHSARKRLASSFCRTKRGDHLKSFFSTISKKLGQPVVSVSQSKAFDFLKQIRRRFEFVPIGGRKLERSNDARQANLPMESNAEKSLTRDFIKTLSRDFAQPSVSVSAGIAAYFERKTIHSRNFRVKFDLAQNFLPYEFFDAP